jgi:fumarylpyruvate hydrolase
MPDLVQPPSLPRLPVLDDADQHIGDFPVGRVFCVGRNYADHAREMGADPDVEPPFFFMKPASAVTTASAVPFPRGTRDLHHEVELVVALDGRRVVACGVGVDLTRRDLQAGAKSRRHPWEVGKVFPGAAPCGALRAGAEVLARPSTPIRLSVSGETRQSGCLEQMIHDVPRLVDALDALFGLAAGDLLFTGTPAGVGPLRPGDELRACVEGLPELAFAVQEPL